MRQGEPWSATSRRRFIKTIVMLAVVLAMVGFAHWPTTMRYGVNYQPFSRQIPLYQKALDFISRDLQARQLTSEVMAGAVNQTDRALKAFDWVGRNIRPVPDGLPIVDDHVWNIIVRGYGADDQRLEVFTLLTSYGCCPATVVRLDGQGGNSIDVAVAFVDGQPRVFDVLRGLMFRSKAGDLATVDELLRQPDLIAAVSHGLAPHGVPYERYLSDLADFRPVFARMERQRPWLRLKYEVGALLTAPARVF